MDSMPGKLEALTERVTSLEERMHETTLALEENTAITRQIAGHTGALVEMVKTYTDAHATVRTLSALGKFTAPLVAGVAAVVGAVVTAWHFVFKG